MSQPIPCQVIRKHRGAILGFAICIATVWGCSTSPTVHQGQQTFATPDGAVRALAAAAKAENTTELGAIFGPGARELLSSGDPGVDHHNREVFVIAIEQGWSLDEPDAQSRELIIGHERWPFPIPLVKEDSRWRFDTAAGKEEVLARRIGRNELAVINICGTYFIAQNEYASQGHDGKPAGIYAQKVRSSPGKQDGLYWPASTPGGQTSPLSDLAAQAEAEGYTASTSTQPRPFYGYYFRILTRQGGNLPDGARNYIVNGEMTGGFALIAYPAQYGNSGVMTFMVGPDGALYEKDLGEAISRLARDIQVYNPDQTWHLVR